MVETISTHLGIIDYLAHFPDHLAGTVERYREWTYAMMFVILVSETGMIFLGWLPGDTMLFTAGVLASASGALDLRLVLALMSLAAFAGDQLNFLIGFALSRNSRLKAVPGGRGDWRGKAAARFEKARSAYADHGGLVIIIGRFIPVLSSIAPLGAAVSGMRYASFIRYSAAGCILWTATFTLAGYFFGKIPGVRDHFWFGIFGIIVFSILSALGETWRNGRRARRAAKGKEAGRRPG